MLRIQNNDNKTIATCYIWNIAIIFWSNWYMESFRGKLIIGIFDMGSLVGYVVYEFLMNLLWQCISIL